MPKSALVFSPHPDDTEYYAGGLVAKMIRQGANVTYIIVTDGRRGSFQYQTGTLAPVRADEARRAAQSLGANEPVLLSHLDYELDRLPTGKLREHFIRLIRQYKPDAVIAEDPFSTYEIHPDHRAVAWAVSDAVHYSSLPLVHPEHMEMGLEPHFVVEKYFYTDNIQQANLIVDISDTIDMKIAALNEHSSQVAFLVEGITREAQLAGLDLTTILGDAAGSPSLTLAWFTRLRAADIGRRKGYSYGEAYRFERFDPYVEKLLVVQAQKKSAQAPEGQVPSEEQQE